MAVEPLVGAGQLKLSLQSVTARVPCNHLLGIDAPRRRLPDLQAVVSPSGVRCAGKPKFGTALMTLDAPDTCLDRAHRSLSCLRHFPEIWNDFATFALEQGYCR